MGAATAPSSWSREFWSFPDWKFEFQCDFMLKVNPGAMEFPALAVDCCRSQSLEFGFFLDWNFDFQSNLMLKICVTTSTSAGLDQTLPRIFYHKVIVVSTFSLFIEGKATSPNVTKVLESIPGIRLMHRTKESEQQQARSCICTETWLAYFFYKPFNYELFMKQSLDMEMAMAMAMARESRVERDDNKEPIREMLLFKANYHRLHKETDFGCYEDAGRANPSYFLTYGNGKSAVREQDHLRPDGPPRGHNYMKFIEPTKEEDVERCFMLEFHRAAKKKHATLLKGDFLASVASNNITRRWTLVGF